MTGPFPDLMIDIETLSTRPDAVVASVGAVAFDAGGAGRAEPLHLVLQLQKQMDLGAHVEADTIRFWFDQDPAVRDETFRRQFGAAPEICLGRLARYVAEQCSEGFSVWAKPPQFDCVILESLHRRLGYAVPWTHRQPRDVRTLLKIAGTESVPSARPHHAREDALAEVLSVQRAFGALRERGVA